ncbi:hypothetical protein Q4543_21855 [Salipiger sp. 1_MG-2023]|uniref:hypothetical protein n=1 Tax=Salipiger sp. 1_MG-2023 TaxID=3062665 RepID=UPI0026E3B209|nr:hypothetical protein [Salipiger sp. 1_MG-2023]MDO6588153.1 hypothetical protein [Salipiger sp. 1_MG-2023]
MTINRRTLILASLAGAALPRSAAAFFDCDPIRFGDLQTGLEMSLWRSAGPKDRAATVYGLVAPWCPRCRELILAAKAGELPLNLRLIPAFARSQLDRQKIWDLIMHPGDEAIDAFHDRRPTTLSTADPAALDTLVNFTDLILQSASIWNRMIYKNEVNATPAVILFKQHPDSETGTVPEIALGYAPQMIPVYRDLARPIVSSGGPFPQEYFRNLPRVENLQPRSISTGPDRGQVHVMPHRNALVAQCFGAGRDLRMTVGTQIAFGEEWLVSKTPDGKLLFLNPDQYSETS